VVSVAVSFLVATVVTAKPNAQASTTKAPGLQALEAGAQHHEHAGEAEHDRSDAAHRHALVQDEHGEKRDPDRQREFEREHGRERQQRDAERPGVGGAEMDRVAQEVERKTARPESRPQRRLRRGEREEDRDPGGIAHRQDLEHVERLRQRAHADRRRRERQERADHPEDDGEDIALSQIAI
jgi:hypothetical protein